MTAVLSYAIACVSTFALLALWFMNAYQVISRKRQDLIHAEEQVRLLCECFNKVRNSSYETSAEKMLETSNQIYAQIEKSYNETLQKPFYRVPGFLMGFRKAEGGSWKPGR